VVPFFTLESTYDADGGTPVRVLMAENLLAFNRTCWPVNEPTAL
jgi:hypothetical protein